MEPLKGLNCNKAVSDLTDKEWEEAKYRYDIIAPIITNKRGATIQKISKKTGVPVRTINRWLHKYRLSPTLSGLVKHENPRNDGKIKLPDEIEAIIRKAIDQKYLTQQKVSTQKIKLEVAMECRANGLAIPHYNTIRNRINLISEEEKLGRREHRSVANNKFDPITGSFPGADYPLAMVQIDHTKLDIICVDEAYREPVGKPWITVAIDVFSRMVIGFYISLDPPGALGTGLCLSHAILQKELWLAELDIKEKWPCYGVMKSIHADNAGEFHGKMLERACQEYGIELNFRPVAKPSYGGHIERLLGTVLKEIHTLPGTTFSNTKERKHYDSEGKACFTIKELETWLANYLVGVYHQRLHTGIKTTPLARWKEGINGSATQIGVGLSQPIENTLKLKLDFMPFVERTVQRQGVVIDQIWYYGDVLRAWIQCYEDPNARYRQLRKFAFKRDPRDISAVYFYDPDLKDYFLIHYRDTTHPPLTIWEHNRIVNDLKARGIAEVNEEVIFDTYAQMRHIEDTAKGNAAAAKRRKNAEKKQQAVKRSIKNDFVPEPPELTDTGFKYDPNVEYLPFEELIHDPFNRNKNSW
jgi:putative transposase